jgi:hypothetical protein
MHPRPEGYGEREQVERELRAEALKLTGAATLADLAREYAIFNHGAFFAHGKLDVDPVADYVARQPDPDLRALPTTFSVSLFRGLSTPGRVIGPPFDWERVLVFVAREYWEGLKAHLLCCGWVDRRRKLYARAVMQTIPIIDVLALDRALIVPAPLPTVEVGMFGVDGTNVHVQFVPSVARPGDTATVVHLPIVPETRTLGAALLSCDPRPFRFIEEDPLAGRQGLVSPAPDF